MLVAVGSFKGSPGATSAMLALTAAWPGPAVGVEADPAGGDLAVRLRTSDGDALPERPSVLSLAAEARSSTDVASLASRFALEVAPGVPVVQGFTDPARSQGLVSLWGDLTRALASSDVDVVVDVGRLWAGSSTTAILRAADAIMVVCRGELGSVVHVRERIGPMAGIGASHQALYPLVVSPNRHADSVSTQIAEVLDATPGIMPGVTYREVLTLAHDRNGLRRLQAGENPRGKLARSALLRSARGAASTVHEASVEQQAVVS